MIKKITDLIINEIEKFKKRKKITQAEFAELAGIPKASFANIMLRLRNNQVPSNEILVKIEKVLNSK